MSEPQSECTCAQNDGTRYACPHCVAELVDDLTAAADHLEHIDDKRARRGSRLWIGYSSPSAETALPYDARVSRVLDPIRNALTTWARLIIDEHQCRDLPEPADTRHIQRAQAELDAWAKVTAEATAPGVQAFMIGLREDIADARRQARLRNLAAVARWVARHADWVATRPWAEELLGEVRGARASLDALMDNPPERYPLGECGHEVVGTTCMHPLTATIDARTVTCPHCGWEHDVAERRLAALKASDDLVVTVVEAERLLRVVGHEVKRRDLWALIRHFGITPALTVKVPGATKPSSVYRLGHLREAAEQMADDDTRKVVAKLKRGA